TLWIGESAAGRTPAWVERQANASALIDLKGATIVTPSNLNLQEPTAVRVLVEDVARRTNLRLPVATTWPAEPVPVIAVGPLATAQQWASAALRKHTARGAP